MKAEIVGGSLVLFPQNDTEAFALGCWFDKNTIKLMRLDPCNLESEHIKGSSIKTSTALMEYVK